MRDIFVLASFFAVLVSVPSVVHATSMTHATSAQTPPPPPEVCAMVYQPVCARTPAGEMKTYGNACEARRAGAAVVNDGACAPQK